MTTSEKRECFQNAYHTLFDFAYRYVALRIPHIQDAEDIVSQSFMQAFERIAQFEPEKGSLNQWFNGIVKHRILDYWRAQRIVLNIEDAESIIMCLENGHKKEQHLDSQLLFERLLKQLSPTLRSLFILRYIDDLNYEQIAEVVNKKPATIRKTFSLIHQQLRLHVHDIHSIDSPL